MITEEKKITLKKFREWAVVQRYTLSRGYIWAQCFLMGIIFASSLKAAFPEFINSFFKFIILVIIGFIVLYFVGWLDRKFGFLAAENNYVTSSTPLMMEAINDIRKSKKKEFLTNG